jgi:hypothetical protein
MTSSLILTLPQDLMYFLANYLLPVAEQNKAFFKFSSDWRRFMNTRKQGFGVWKKQSQLIGLKSLHTEKFRRSALFRKRILQLVESPWEQIEFHFEYKERQSFTVGKAEILARTFTVNNISLCLRNIFFNSCTIAALSDCPSIQAVMIDYCRFGENPSHHMKDLESLQQSYFSQVELQMDRLEALSISSVNEIVDVSYFKNIQKVRFHFCKLITDVTSLANVFDLNLTFCDGITDVSSLGNVYNLNLSGCHNISDVSALGNVHSLNLQYCPGVRDVSCLKNVYELDLGSFMGTSLVGLENVVKLNINNSVSVSDITMLKNVTVLRMNDCPLITNYSGLVKVQKLTTGFNVDEQLGTLTITSGMETFSRLEALTLWGHSFEESGSILSDISQLSWNHLTNIRRLKLWETTFTRFPETFLCLQLVEIVRCNDFIFLPDLPASVGSLFIEDCPKLTDLHISGANRKYPIYSVNINECLNLRRLKVSRKISSMVITGCTELLELTILNQIGSLQTKYCSKLIYYSSYAAVGCCQLNCENDNWLREYEDD